MAKKKPDCGVFAVLIGLEGISCPVKMLPRWISLPLRFKFTYNVNPKLRVSWKMRVKDGTVVRCVRYGWVDSPVLAPELVASTRDHNTQSSGLTRGAPEQPSVQSMVHRAGVHVCPHLSCTFCLPLTQPCQNVKQHIDMWCRKLNKKFRMENHL